MAILLSVLLLLLVTTAAQPHSATTCTRGETGSCRMTDGSVADINAAISFVAAGSSGTTTYVSGVYVPAGSFTWGSTIAILSKHGLVLAGAGSGSTLITCSSAPCATFSHSNRVRITGMQWSASSGYLTKCFGESSNFRIDNMKWRGTTTGYSFNTDLAGAPTNTAHCYGLLDHNDHGTAGGPMLINGNMEGTGDFSQYQTPVDFSSRNTVIFEDNTVLLCTDQDSFETHRGGSFVIRHNVITECPTHSIDSFIDQHHTQQPFTAQGHGGRYFIANDNTINYTNNIGFSQHLYVRAGTGLYYNNTVDYHIKGSPPARYLGIIDFRSNQTLVPCPSTSAENYSLPSLYVFGMAACVSTSYHPNGVNVFPQGEGWPGKFGPGIGVPGGTREPIYFWGNKEITPASFPGTVAMPSSAIETFGNTLTMQSGRDYCFTTSTTPLSSCGGIPLGSTGPPYPDQLQGGADVTTPAAPTNLRFAQQER